MLHKGAITDRQIDRSHPHQVETPIPSGGLGERLKDMYAFVRGRDCLTRGVGRRPTGQDATRWCFATAEQADAFHARFGGERITLV